jgi:L-alanine-DL-glutamate epimerase-like enolase superfamily enzyme
MKITDITTIQLNYPLERAVYDANYTMSTKPALLVEVRTDEGVTGIGEAAHFGGPLISTKVAIEEELKYHVLGEDPLHAERLWERMHQRSYKHARGGLIIAAISGIDIALWDIKGKVAGLPVYKLLGGYSNVIPAYATGGFYAEGHGLPELAKEMEEYIGRGFRAVKMKVGRNSSLRGGFNPLRAMSERGVCEVSLEEDLERVEVVRKVVGKDALLMIDANGAWDVPTAIQMGHKFETYDIYWFEEPVSPDDIEGSARVAASVDIPIAGYETCSYGRFTFKQYIAARAVHFVQPDIAWSGGLTECIKIAHMASAWNLPVAPHIHGSAVAVAAGLHYLAAIPNGTLAEIVYPAHPLIGDLVGHVFDVNQEGEVRLPDKPGLGIELNPKIIEKYRIDR